MSKIAQIRLLEGVIDVEVEQPSGIPMDIAKGTTVEIELDNDEKLIDVELIPINHPASIRTVPKIEGDNHSGVKKIKAYAMQALIGRVLQGAETENSGEVGGVNEDRAEDAPGEEQEERKRFKGDSIRQEKEDAGGKE